MGLVTHHTLTPLIINKFGSYGMQDINNISNWSVLCMDDALVPFQNSVDSDRLTMATAHSKQVTAINNRERAYVSTGAEYIVPQLASKRFCHKARQDGEVTEIVKNKYITIQYKDGSIDRLDIIPRLSRTKMGMYMGLELESNLKVGDKFVKNQVIANTRNFKNGIYTSGKNVHIAVMNYLGYSHEDAYVIGAKLAEETTSDVYKEVQIIVPPNTKVLKLETEFHKKITSNDILVEFVYEMDLNDYIEINNLENVEDENNELSNYYSQSDNTIKLHGIDGEIIDIKVYINNKNSIDKRINDFHQKLVKDNKLTIAKLAESKYNDKIEVLDNMNVNYFETGEHKYKGVEFLGARIVYYIKTKRNLKIGDKMASRFGAKGVISHIVDPEAKSEFSGNIDVFISPISIFARKNLAFVKELYIGKIIHYLTEHCKELASDNNIKMEDIKQLILDTYKSLASDNVYNSVAKFINSFTLENLRKEILKDDFHFYFIVEPFDKSVTFKRVKSTAQFLNIPLDEKVYIPETKSWTNVPVPVGYSYYQFLEHHSDTYSNIRGAGKYQSLTRQPTKGKSKEGGQAIGNLDVYALLTYEVDNVLNEFLTLRSDDHKSKRQVYNSIIQDGKANMPESTGNGATQNLFSIYMTALGLDIRRDYYKKNNKI